MTKNILSVGVAVAVGGVVLLGVGEATAVGEVDATGVLVACGKTVGDSLVADGVAAGEADVGKGLTPVARQAV